MGTLCNHLRNLYLKGEDISKALICLFQDHLGDDHKGGADNFEHSHD